MLEFQRRGGASLRCRTALVRAHVIGSHGPRWRAVDATWRGAALSGFVLRGLSDATQLGMKQMQESKGSQSTWRMSPGTQF